MTTVLKWSWPTPAPIYLLNPERFDPDACLPAHLTKYGDHARYFVHAMLTREAQDWRRDVGPGRYVGLKADTLRRYFPNPAAYKAVRDRLVASGMIDCDNRYDPGSKSLAYRPGEPLRGSCRRLVRVPVQNALLAKKLREFRERRDEGLSGVHRDLRRQLDRVELDFDGAMARVRRRRGRRRRLAETSLHMLALREWFFHVCPYGRVHTNLTNLRSELRAFLTCEGQPLVNLDIRNSQPLIFALLLRKQYPEDSARPDDVKRYIDLVQAGRFYDDLMERCGIPAEDRARFKKRFFASVFFCANGSRSEIADAFASHYPNVAALIHREKERDHRALARKLQEAESDVMIKGVAARCMDELPDAFVGTIHDSILTTVRHSEPAREIILEEFRKRGIHPTVQIEETDISQRRCKAA